MREKTITVSPAQAQSLFNVIDHLVAENIELREALAKQEARNKFSSEDYYRELRKEIENESTNGFITTARFQNQSRRSSKAFP